MSEPMKRVSTGTPWEKKVGYSRAVRVGSTIYVSGTVASDASGRVISPGDAAGQARYIFRKIGAALDEAGASLADVVRTRMFVIDMNLADRVGPVHAEFFGDVLPASTMLAIAGLADPQHLVEIEVEAVIR